MDFCWAAPLGNCSEKITREHIFTNNIWEGDEIGVKGLPWCLKQHQFIPKEDYCYNILCETHNNGLSPVDQVGINSFTLLRNAWKYHKQRVDLVEAGQWSGPFKKIHQTINGRGLQRWFLKALINAEVAGEQGYRIGPWSADKNRPSRELVEIAFGRRAFTGGAGLYLAVQEDVLPQALERITYTSCIRQRGDDRYVAAGLFYFIRIHLLSLS